MDACNSKVLYISPCMSISSIQFDMKGMDGMNDMNNGFGPWGK